MHHLSLTFVLRLKLQAEIKIHRTLKHSNVCEYKHFFEDRQNCYILLELCHNQSMNEMIKRRKRLTEAESAYFGRQILEATQYLHENLVIHRDLKLGNLFLDRNMNIKVGDLGLATKLESADEKRKTICGTPNYIAPEVIQGDRATRGHSFEVDIWSLGVILYTCMCGRPPYEAKDVKATYQRILANEYSFPKDVKISDSAKDIIRSMLQSKPSDRPKLHQIAVHPFFTQQPLPQSIPSTATHVAPQWVENEYGELVVESSKNPKLENSSKPGLPRANTLRRPFASRDVNVDRASSDRQKSAGKQGRDVMEGAVKTALSALANIGGTVRSPPAPAAPAQPAFRVFDETESNKRSAIPDYKTRKASPPSQAIQMEEDIVSRTAALSIRAQDSAPFHPAMASPAVNGTGQSLAAAQEQDTLILQNMIGRIDAVLEVTSRRSYSHVHPDSPSLTAFARGGPPIWVSRYVDYTSKYGLGFLLNDGRYVYIVDSAYCVGSITCSNSFGDFSALVYTSMIQPKLCLRRTGKASSTSNERSRRKTLFVVASLLSSRTLCRSIQASCRRRLLS
jgi:serine/threonine protein kinase